MTAQRRSRHHSPDPDPQDRLRALGLDSSPSARRLRARIPRPRPSEHTLAPAVNSGRAPVRAEEVPGVQTGQAPSAPTGEVPSAPYAIETTAPYQPAAPRKPGSPAHRKTTVPARATTRAHASAWPERDPDDTLALPGQRVGPRGSTRGGGPSSSSSSATAISQESEPGPWHPDGELGAEEEEEEARRRRPPSGYTEFNEEPDPWSERITRLLGPNFALSRRAVLVLLVLGLLATVGALLVLRDSPETVTVSEAEPQAAAESGEEAAHAAEEEEEGGTAPEGDAADPESQGEVVVHVGGEVADPGLYTLPPGSRVSDAVDEAGGPLADADLDLLNLARPLEDGEQILVGVPEAEGGADTDGPQQGGSDLVNVNRADADLLETLPGIGETIAGNIIDHRDEHGPFGSVDDLIDVNRIGEKVLEDLEPLVTVG